MRTAPSDRPAHHIIGMPGPCRLYMVRHGTTRMNVQNRYRGRCDVPLDAQGYQDAVDAARRLSGVGLAAVYTGPLRRTIATANVIADEAGVPDIRILHGLINLDYGAWEGMTSAEASAHDARAFELYTASPQRAFCPDGEKLSVAQDRIIAALRLIGERHRDEAVCAVTHAVMIRLVIARLVDLGGEKWRVEIDRGGVTEFEVDGDDIRLVTPIRTGNVAEDNFPAVAAGG